jgi:hypothetical protein
MCPSLSGASSLRFEIGCTDAGDIQLRLTGNSGSGSFSREWIDMEAVKSALDKAPRGAPITSEVLRPLFRKTSINNQLFFFGVLMHEGLVRRVDGRKRGYERVEVGEFVKWKQALINGKGTAAVGESRNVKAKTKSGISAKTPTASRKK